MQGSNNRGLCRFCEEVNEGGKFCRRCGSPLEEPGWEVNVRENLSIFLSHSGEDKQQVALPLANYLESRGFRVWLDECELLVGDSLRRSIDKGLSLASFGVVVLSPSYLKRIWTNRELDGLVAREDGGLTLILPIWHNLSQEDVLRYSPILAGRVAVSTDLGLERVAEQVVRSIERNYLGEAEDRRPMFFAEKKEEELAQLRRQLLSARSRHDLQRTLYDAEEFLVRYPGNPGVRFLIDQVKSALDAGPSAALARAEPTRMQRESRRGCSVIVLFLFLMILLIGILMNPRSVQEQGSKKPARTPAVPGSPARPGRPHGAAPTQRRWRT
jgi:hypothetical protein